MSKFSQLTKGMPIGRVRAVVPGVLSRFFHRLGLFPVRWEMLRQLAIARLFWKLDWRMSLSLDENRAATEREVEEHLDFIYFEIGDEARRAGKSAPPVLPAGKPEEFPGGYIGLGIDGLSMVFIQLAHETARELTLDWNGGELAIHVLGDEEGRWMAEHPPESHQRLWIEMIRLLLDRRRPLQEKRVLASKDGEGGFVGRFEGQEVKLRKPRGGEEGA